MSTQRKVLIVDDETDVVELLGFRLEKMGYKILKAYDGEAGLKMARAERPDLILLDIFLPKRDGIAVCHELKRDPKTRSIPVILISASCNEIEKGKAISRADGFLRKPFEPGELLKAIDPYLKVA